MGGHRHGLGRYPVALSALRARCPSPPDITAGDLEAFVERCADDGQAGGKSDDGQAGDDGDDDEKPGLPVTSGSPLSMLIGGRLALLLAGAGAMLLASRRRVTIG